MNSTEFLKKYAWIKRGSQRKEVIKNIPEDPFVGEELRKKINEKTNLKLSLREISRHLTSFAKQGFVKCITPDAPYGRLYIITKTGKELKNYLIIK